jgi:hypothetical protein
MKLIDNWKKVLRHGWSPRLILVAGLLSGAEVALPILDSFIYIPRGIFAVLSFVTTCAAFWARFVAQNQVSGDKDADQ